MLRKNQLLIVSAKRFERLHEDLTSSFQKPNGPRHASVQVCEPVLLSEILSESPKLREAVAILSQRLETTIQSGVDAANDDLETVGSELF